MLRTCLPVLALLPALAAAQDFVGLVYNVEATAASRGMLGNNAGETMTRIDGSQIAGWGAETPGRRTIRSIACIVQDLDAATPEYFDIRLYPEHPTNAGFPDLTAGVTFFTGAPGPTGSGGLAALRVVTPIAPVSVPIQGGGDVFVSFVMPVATATDGLSMQIVLGYSTGSFTRWDTPNTLLGGTPPPAAGPNNSYFLTRIGASATYQQRRQIWVDVQQATAGGTGLAITNQTSYPTSNNPPPAGWGPAPGTADFLSGSFPDGSGSNPGRADDIAMEFTKFGFGSGRIVAFLRDLDFTPAWGPEIPVGSVFFGSTGVTCLV